MPARKRVSPPVSVVVLLLCAVLAAGGPTAAEAWTTMAWVRWHGARGADGVANLEAARRVGRDAARGVALLAPLPWAAQAAGAAIDVAGPLVAERPALAAALLADLRSGLDPVAASSWRGYGLAAFAARAAVLEDEARQAARATGGRQ
ncbi:MAG: hypothetical protein NDJ94_02940 [Vicinamibacteria bacterium]|jgi:hypothetical protein|nr:hypothetical protein [Vicinamibacteria bacterium]